jgi:VNT family MFS transporter (synaptic vesicle glycoprotein 2)
MLVCSACSFLFSLISSFSTHVWMLIITRFFVGFFISGLAANTYAYIGEFHCDTNRARHLNFCGVFMAFALTFCPGVGWIILKFQETTSVSFYISFLSINYSIWRIFLLICSSLSLFIVFFLFHLPESPKFLLYQDRHDEALRILQDIYKANTGSTYFSILKISIDEQLVNRIELGKGNIFKLLWTQTSPLFRSPLLKHTWKLSFIMFSLFAASSGFYMWTPEILNRMIDHGGMSVCDVIDTVIGSKNSTASANSSCTSSIIVNDTIYSITFFMGVFFSAVYFLNGLVINKFGKRNLLGLWFFICGLASILIPFNNNFYVILLLLLLFLTSGCCGSIASAIIVDLYPTNIR